MSESDIIQKLQQIESLTRECLAELGKAPKDTANKISGKSVASSKSIDFSMPMRNFIFQHAKSMKGLGEKFTLVLAFLSKGEESKQIPLSQIEEEWKKMTAGSLLGAKFNRSYTEKAKSKDLVYSPKVGFYSLRPNWQQIFHG